MTEPEKPTPPATVTGLFAAADVAPGTVLAGRFRIEAMLGLGGMGMVYRATDLDLGITVAVKLLRPELATRPEAFERFRQELLLARQVSSPHVVRIHDIARHEDRWLISMDLIEGESLDRMLDRRGPLPVDEALRIARQLAEGLAAAHARGVVHRDLKPSNVLIDRAGNASIGDFGVARSLGSSGFTQAGAIVGTPDYLSPEQARGEPVDARSDLYALGLILYEMLSGRQAFAGSTPAESLSQRILRPPDPVVRHRPDTPAWVARLLARLLQPRPSHRFADATAVIRAIDQRHVPLDLRPGRRTGIALAVLALLVLLGWLGLRLPLAPPALPPDRLLIVADDSDTDADAWLAAVEHLRQGIAELPGMAVVDGDRTAQALAQLGLPGSGVRDSEPVAQLVPARRHLHVTLHHGDDGYRLAGELTEAGTRRRIDGQAAATLPAATTRFGDALAAALQPRAAFPSPLLPATGASLAAYGRSLRERRSGRPEQALASLREVTAGEPAYAPAWLALGEAAWQTGNTALAAQAAATGLATPAPRRLRLDLQTLAALAGGEHETAAAALRAHLQQVPDDLAATLRLAQLLGEHGDFDGASHLLQSLLARDGDDPRAWYLLGKYSILRGDARRAVDEQLLRALVLYKRARNPHGEAEATNALGIGYIQLGQTTDAEEQYRRALALRRAVQDRRGTAATLHNLARVAMLRGNTGEAESHLLEARALFEELGDRASLATMDRELAVLAEERGDYPAALDAYRRVLRSREEAGDAAGAAESLNDIGFAHFQLGAYDSAQVFWQQAADAFAALRDPRGGIRARQNLGLLDIARGRWDDARRQLEAALAEAERRQMAEETAVSRRNLAELAIVQGRIGEALAQLDRAETLFRERQDQRGLLDTGLLRVRALLAAGAVARALERLDALEATLQAASHEQRAIAALLRAEAVRRQGSDGRLAALAEEALRQAEAAGVPALALQARALRARDTEFAAIGESFERLGNLPLRLAWLRLALERRLAAGDIAAAIAEYHDATAALAGRGNYAGAFELHRLGATALARDGQHDAADTARQAARTALDRLADGLPADLREALLASPEAIALRENADA